MPRAPTRIDDPNDPRIANYRDLRDADAARAGTFVAESPRVLRHLLKTGAAIESILLTEAQLENLADVLGGDGGAGAEGTSIYTGTPATLEAIAGMHIHRGVLASVRRPSDTSLDTVLGDLRERDSFRLAVVEALTDAYNVGAIFRNAAAFGFDAVVLDPRCLDPLYRKAIRASVGHSISLPWARSEDWPHDLARLQTDWGATLLAATPEGTVPLWEAPRPARLAVVVGAEDTGLTSDALSRCDARVQIPMHTADSLNVGVASAVFFYELTRP